MQTFIKAILAGLCIGFGGLLYLSIENPIIGAFLFTFGLFTIVTFGFNLFTGKACYVIGQKPSYYLDLLLIWLGNLVGTGIIAYLARLTRIAPLADKALRIANTKLNDDLLSVFILAIFCNIMIFIAVEGFKKIEYPIGKYMALYLGVVCFILCSFEHCIANMFYFSFANVWSLHTCIYLIVITIGNMIGAIIFPILMKLVTKEA